MCRRSPEHISPPTNTDISLRSVIYLSIFKLPIKFFYNFVMANSKQTITVVRVTIIHISKKHSPASISGFKVLS